MFSEWDTYAFWACLTASCFSKRGRRWWMNTLLPLQGFLGAENPLKKTVPGAVVTACLLVYQHDASASPPSSCCGRCLMQPAYVPRQERMLRKDCEGIKRTPAVVAKSEMHTSFQAPCWFLPERRKQGVSPQLCHLTDTWYSGWMGTQWGCYRTRQACPFQGPDGDGKPS